MSEMFVPNRRGATFGRLAGRTVYVAMEELHHDETTLIGIHAQQDSAKQACVEHEATYGNPLGPWMLQEDGETIRSGEHVVYTERVKA